MMDRKDNTRMYKAIDVILWEQWDPCGVNIFPGARDEYHSYITKIMDLVTSGGAVENIRDYLLYVEKERMGLPGRKKKCLEVAKSLSELK